jgi:hypothetical protein
MSWLTISSMLCAQSLQAQSLKLTEHSVASEQFTRVLSAAELTGNRVLIADGGGEGLVVYNWSAGTLTRVARRGRGPGDLLEVGRLFPIASDSVLVEDPGLHQWSVFNGRSLGAAMNSIVRAGASMARLAGGDRTLNFVEVRPGLDGRYHDGRRAILLPDATTLQLLRGKASTTQLESIGMLKGPYAGDTIVPRALTPGGRPIPFRLSALLTAEEQALLLPNGVLTFLRYAPLRVEFRRGTTVFATIAIPFLEVTADARERQFAFERAHSESQRRTLRQQDFPGWPRVVPPVESGGLLAGPDGTVVVVMRPTARTPVQTLVFVRTGGVADSLTLPSGHRLVGVSDSTVYAISKDQDELEILHRWKLVRTSAPGRRTEPRK